VNGYRHQEGKYTWAEDGSVYKGGWKEGKRNGYGIYTDQFGKQYKEEWDMETRISKDPVQPGEECEVGDMSGTEGDNEFV